MLLGFIFWYSPIFYANHKFKTSKHSVNDSTELNKTIIFVITPTYSRPERLADMTRFAQTLMHVRDLIWIVVEDGKNLSDPLERLLKRSGISYVYLKAAKTGEIPGRELVNSIIHFLL